MPERWYLRSETPWQLSTTSIEQVEDRSIRELMPQGIDALRWSKVLAEVEMLFLAIQPTANVMRQGNY